MVPLPCNNVSVYPIYGVELISGEGVVSLLLSLPAHFCRLMHHILQSNLPFFRVHKEKHCSCLARYLANVGS
uniref:Uncharacterized protein n=1 Tax=Arundo donax TaxID=35708 RepID=A0A0A9ULC2_ARUDO